MEYFCVLCPSVVTTTCSASAGYSAASFLKHGFPFAKTLRGCIFSPSLARLIGGWVVTSDASSTLSTSSTPRLRLVEKLPGGSAGPIPPGGRAISTRADGITKDDDGSLETMDARSSSAVLRTSGSTPSGSVSINASSDASASFFWEVSSSSQQAPGAEMELAPLRRAGGASEKSTPCFKRSCSVTQAWRSSGGVGASEKSTLCFARSCSVPQATR
mmetsp:Transcript_7970/g.26470  ORF Transcript_7970/g.26470 Transcript_7970/m.26470 type:complete len:216 (+) Transcript_7970:118-765(+)